MGNDGDYMHIEMIKKPIDWEKIANEDYKINKKELKVCNDSNCIWCK